MTYFGASRFLGWVAVLVSMSGCGASPGGSTGNATGGTSSGGIGGTSSGGTSTGGHGGEPPCTEPCGCSSGSYLFCPPAPKCVGTVNLGTCEPAKASLVSSDEGYLLEALSAGGMGGTIENTDIEQRLVLGVSGECSAIGLTSSVKTKVTITRTVEDACGYGEAVFVGNLNDLGALPLGTYFADIEFSANEPVVLSFGSPRIEK